ncbi:MAG TPA: hypothetical protein VEV84_11955 [Pyrinomonadaceae bacterium]|nr:hypothetical protein [Pyrinomonadaceae bacterium]
MYPQNQPIGGPPPASSNKSTIIVVVLVALIFIVVAAILAGAIGFFIGRSSSESNAAQKTEAGTPPPAPTASAMPTPTPTPTPSPTPDINGKYTGPTGDVEISNVTTKTFNFNIGVGNSNGSGQIDGQATRTSPSLGVYSQIPDPDLYNDPDSSYYHKKCHITFRFTPGKVSVSEDDFACNYWHGAAVDFNGTFSQKKK